MIIPQCANDVFGLEAYYWKQFQKANEMIETTDKQISEVTSGPSQYSFDSQQSRMSTMTHRLGELTKAREYWVTQRMDAIANLTRLGVGVDECCNETGLTVMVPAF
jgi:hypothetical protein